MPHTISKSAFIKGMQCSKQLYLHYHYPQLRDKLSKLEKAKFKRGIDFGNLVHRYFPDGKNALSPGDYNAWFSKTENLIEKGTKSIFEAAFRDSYQMAAVDIFVKSSNQWEIWEVKSVLNISATHLQDLAYQYLLLTRSGYSINKAGIIHLNQKYQRKKQIILDELLQFTNMIDEVMYKADQLAPYLEELSEILLHSNIPAIKPSAHCIKPYACSFMGYCWKNIDLNFDSKTNEGIENINTTNTFKNNIDEMLFEKRISNELRQSQIGEEDFQLPAVFYIRPMIPFFENTSPFQKLALFIIHEDYSLTVARNWVEGIYKPLNDKTIETAANKQLNNKQTLFTQEIEASLNNLFNHLAICENIIEQQQIIAEIEMKIAESVALFIENSPKNHNQ